MLGNPLTTNNLKMTLVMRIPVGVGSNVYMSKRSADVLLHRHSRRLADYDGTPLSFRVAVLLLSPQDNSRITDQDIELCG
jgi:hypothetical protein